MTNFIKQHTKIFLAQSFDFLMAGISFYLSIVLRLGDWSPDIVQAQKFPETLLFMTLTQSLVFYFNGLYKGVWRYSSTNDLVRVIRATVTAVPASLLVAFLYTRLEGIPRSAFLIHWLILVITLGGGRFLYRILRDYYFYKTQANGELSNCLIIGAGYGGEQLLREIKKNRTVNLKVSGFLDDSLALKGRTIHGVSILGPIQEAGKHINKYAIKKVFIAIPSASGGVIRKIIEGLKGFDLEIKTLPKFSDILGGQISFDTLREVKIEDLLGRQQVELDIEPISAMITGKKVLVTGAGGSIGSELCRQIIQFKPDSLTTIDSSEFNCYQLDKELKDQNVFIKTIVGDVRDTTFIDKIFENEKPDIVLHAAAYKHVPLMEFNPYQSVKTNVLGTKTVAEAAIKYQAKRFVLISSDKAVNPTNIMGTSKRIAEMVLQNLKKNSEQTKLITVRFGNVLGSSGSVIPLFKEQIASGGPVTVTHPDITRFFMSIPEASQLVLQAASLGQGEEIFVLDMGQPVKIVDLAQEMISLAAQDRHILIKFTGLRPGEKLYEEPLMGIEHSLPTIHTKVKISKTRETPSYFQENLEQLLNLKSYSQREEYIILMQKLVPEYTPFQSAPQTLNH